MAAPSFPTLELGAGHLGPWWISLSWTQLACSLASQEILSRQSLPSLLWRQQRGRLSFQPSTSVLSQGHLGAEETLHTLPKGTHYNTSLGPELSP